MNLKVLRYEINGKYTLGAMFVNNFYLGYTLEDVARPDGEKVFGETAIPAGKYELELYNSPHFGKLLPHIKNVPNFEGVLIHGGNLTSDTEGCILVAEHNLSTPDVGQIQGSLSTVLVGMLQKNKEPHTIQIFNVK